MTCGKGAVPPRGGRSPPRNVSRLAAIPVVRVTRLMAWVACGVLAAATADARELPWFKRAAESTHVTLYAPPAGGPNVERLERELGDVARMLGESKPRVQLFFYEHASDIAVATGVYAGGVTFPGLGQIHSTAYRLRHEMVHLVASKLGGDPGPFYQEGLAVALGDGGRHNDGRPVDDVARGLLRGAPMSELIAGFASTNPQEGYPIAGSFMRFLLKRHGYARVVRFFRACVKERSGDVYQEVFGESVEATGSLWTSRLFGDRKPEPARAWPAP